MGIEAARRLRRDARLTEVPIVMLTGRTLDRDIETAFADGVTDYITKPFGGTRAPRAIAGRKVAR